MDCRVALGLALMVPACGVLVSAQAGKFTPPRLVRVQMPPVPEPRIVGGGEVLLEFIIDQRGFPTRPGIVRSTPPFTQMMLDAVSRWHFEPAKVADERGIEQPVDAAISVAAAFRPPTMVNGPVLGEAPKDLMKPSGEASYPLSIPMPDFPPQALDGSVVLYELSLDANGRLTNSRNVAVAPGYEGVTRSALSTMVFRGALYRTRPVPSSAYVVFGFRSPVTPGVPGCSQPPCKEPPPKLFPR